ncbi:MAG: transposase family protein [Cytophagaceae bacterium]|nr:transposase family protein [Cytophagaceae bacterium]
MQQLGIDSWDTIELFGKMHIEFLKQMCEVPNDIPFHDTINNGFSLLIPHQF